MTYSDKDILDLYEDLQKVGLSETPAEEAQRGLSIISKTEIQNIKEASKILTENGILHEFLTIKSKSSSWDCLYNLLFIRGFRVATSFAGPSFTITDHPISWEEIKSGWKELGYKITYEAWTNDVDSLQEPFMV